MFFGFPGQTNTNDHPQRQVFQQQCLWQASLQVLGSRTGGFFPEAMNETVQFVWVRYKECKIGLRSVCLLPKATNAGPSKGVSCAMGSPGCPLMPSKEYNRSDWSMLIKKPTTDHSPTCGNLMCYRCFHLDLYKFQSTSHMLLVTHSIV